MNKDDVIESIREYVNKMVNNNSKMTYGLNFNEESIFFDTIYEYLEMIGRTHDYHAILYIVINRGLNNSILSGEAVTLASLMGLIREIGSIGYTEEQISELEKMLSVKPKSSKLKNLFKPKSETA